MKFRLVDILSPPMNKQHHLEAYVHLTSILPFKEIACTGIERRGFVVASLAGYAA